MSFSIVQSDCLDFLRSFPADSVDLIFTSPPYEKARLYLENGVNLSIARDTEEWVKWLVEVFGECRRVCTGLVAMVVEGQTSDFRYSCGPALLMADLYRTGFNLRKPPIYQRVGIPGSGGPDWLRNDWEWIICTTRPGKLPWSDNTACGSPPIYGPGGDCTHRKVNGDRTRKDKRLSDRDSGRPPEERQNYTPPAVANPGNIVNCGERLLSSLNIIDILECYEQLAKEHSDSILRSLREAVDAKDLPRWWARIYSRIREEAILQSYLSRRSALSTKRPEVGRTATPRKEDCQEEEAASGVRKVRIEDASSRPSSGRGRDKQRDGESRRLVHEVPSSGTQAQGMQGNWLREALLRPGVLLDSLHEIQEVWRSFGEAAESSSSSAESSNVISCIVGGGNMGSPISSANEAPFPEKLAAFFVKSFCRPGGTVCDPFVGSGTTASVAVENGRNFVGCDLRQSQVDLALRRLGGVTPDMFAAAEATSPTT